MRSRSWLILSLGFGTLILLIGLLGFGAMRQGANPARRRLSPLMCVFADRRRLAGDPGRSVSERHPDSRLPPGPVSHHGSCLPGAAVDQAVFDSAAARISSSNGCGCGRRGKPARLRAELQGYWESMDPILDLVPAGEGWCSAGRSFGSEVLPRREAVVALAREISEINAANLRKEQQRLQGSQALFQSFLRRTVLLTLALGLLVAVISAVRVAILERRSEQQRGRAEQRGRGTAPALPQVGADPGGRAQSRCRGSYTMPSARCFPP